MLFFELDPSNSIKWGSVDVIDGVLIEGNIQIGEYRKLGVISPEVNVINVIVRYEETMFVEAFCRVSPRESLSEVENQTQFCKTFRGLISDEAPYRSCPLCTYELDDSTIDDCQQNIILPPSPTDACNCPDVIGEMQLELNELRDRIVALQSVSSKSSDSKSKSVPKGNKSP